MEMIRSRSYNEKQTLDIDERIRHGLSCEDNQKWAEALEIYNTLLGGDPTEPQKFEIFKNLGNTLLKTGDFDGAEENYHKAYRIFPSSPILAINYGVLEIQRGQLDKAKARFVEVLGTDDTNDLAWVGLALVHRGHADFDLSRACMLRALDVNPINKTALVQYYKWCREDSVPSDIEKVEAYLATEPGDEEIQSILEKYNA